MSEDEKFSGGAIYVHLPASAISFLVQEAKRLGSSRSAQTAFALAYYRDHIEEAGGLVLPIPPKMSKKLAGERRPPQFRLTDAERGLKAA